MELLSEVEGSSGWGRGAGSPGESAAASERRKPVAHVGDQLGADLHRPELELVLAAAAAALECRGGRDLASAGGLGWVKATSDSTSERIRGKGTARRATALTTLPSPKRSPAVRPPKEQSDPGVESLVPAWADGSRRVEG
jgi:hypothetical protein